MVKMGSMEKTEIGVFAVPVESRETKESQGLKAQTAQMPSLMFNTHLFMTKRLK
jgi:hypothetical protein